MKKLLFGAVALAMLATTSCKKDDDAKGPDSSITAAGQTYAITSFNTSAGQVTIVGGSGNDVTTFTMRFGSTVVPGEGTYNIVANADEADEVQIGVGRVVNSTITGYQSQDGSANLRITMDNNKMRVSFPNTTVTPITGMGSENITISANAMQP